VSTQVRDRIVRSQARGVRPARIPFDLSAPEVIAAFVGIALLVWVVFYYFTSVKPQQDRLHAL